MSAGLKDLLDYMRQHPAFPELLKAVPAPAVRNFKLSEAERADAQTAQWIYRSGQTAMHEQWRFLLTDYDPIKGNTTSQQEKS